MSIIFGTSGLFIQAASMKLDHSNASELTMYVLFQFDFTRYLPHCCLNESATVYKVGRKKPHMFFIPITIPEFDTSVFLAVTVWTPDGAAIVFAQSWNFELKFFLHILFVRKIGSRVVIIHFLIQKGFKRTKNLNLKGLRMPRKRAINGLKIH